MTIRKWVATGIGSCSPKRQFIFQRKEIRRCRQNYPNPFHPRRTTGSILIWKAANSIVSMVSAPSFRGFAQPRHDTDDHSQYVKYASLCFQ